MSVTLQLPLVADALSAAKMHGATWGQIRHPILRYVWTAALRRMDTFAILLQEPRKTVTAGLAGGNIAANLW